MPCHALTHTCVYDGMPCHALTHTCVWLCACGLLLLLLLMLFGGGEVTAKEDQCHKGFVPDVLGVTAAGSCPSIKSPTC